MSSGCDTDYTENELGKFLKGVEASAPEKKKKKQMPTMVSDDNSSDSYDSFTKKNIKKKTKISTKDKSDNDENTAFTTSQNNTDYTQLDKHAPTLSEDDDESEKIYHRPPPPSSVAFHLRTSSDDEDEEIDSKIKPKPKISINHRPAESVAPNRRTKIEVTDGSINKQNRPVARSFAPSTSSIKSSKSSKSRKWTPDMVNENQLDRELKLLRETESRLTAAEHERLMKDEEFFIGDNFSKSGDNQSRKKQNNQKQMEVQLEEDESFNQPTQSIAESYYAKMLSKKFSHLIKKKNNLHKRQDKRFHVDFNDNIIHWSREMITSENEKIQNEINKIIKDIKKLNRENDELKYRINLFNQNDNFDDI